MRSSVNLQTRAWLFAFVATIAGCGGTSSPQVRYAPLPDQQIPLQQVLLFKDRATFDEVMGIIKVESTEAREKRWLRDMMDDGRAIMLIDNLPVEILGEEGDAVKVKVGSNNPAKDPNTFGKEGYIHSAWLHRS